MLITTLNDLLQCDMQDFGLWNFIYNVVLGYFLQEKLGIGILSLSLTSHF